MNLEYHPYSEVFELIDDGDFDLLAADIAKHGLRDKIWLYEGKILDGRNRYMACRTAKVEPEFREYIGDDPGAFVWSVNAHRRHLTVGQRAMAAAELARLSACRPAVTAGIPAVSQTQAATRAKISRDSVQQAKKVVDNGSDELKTEVKKGRVSLNKAVAVIDLPKEEQLHAAQKKPESASVTKSEIDISDYDPEEDDAFKANIENVLMADDKLAAMVEQLKQLHRDLHVMRESRDHYQNQSGEAVRLLKVRDREIEKLNRLLKIARGEA